MNDFLTRFRILPLLVLVALAAFAVRIGDTVLGMKNMAAEVMAEEALKLEDIQPAAGDAKEDYKDEKAAADQKEEAPKEDAKKEDNDHADQADETSSDDEPQPSKDVAEPKVSLPDATLPEVWAEPSAETMADTPEQVQLLEDLAARRQELDARERVLQNKEALLQATEKQIDEKLVEMTALKDQIQKLLGQQDAEETAKIQSLVKIYEGMKAKSAAEIFNQMDIEILVQVVSKMSERKSAPIIAAMDTARANELTVRLSEMKQLPAPKAQMPMQAGPLPTAAPAGSAELPGLDALGKPGM